MKPSLISTKVSYSCIHLLEKLICNKVCQMQSSIIFIYIFTPNNKIYNIRIAIKILMTISYININNIFKRNICSIFKL